MLKLNLYLVLLYMNLKLLSASKIDLSQEFTGENLRDIEFKTFRIPLSVILSVTQEARVKALSKKHKVTSEKVANKATISSMVRNATTWNRQSGTVTNNAPVTNMSPVQITTEEPPPTFVVPIHIADDNENELVEDVTTITSVGEEVVSEEVAEEQPTEPPQQDVVGQTVRFPCQCVNGQCGCCTGVFMERLRMKACGNISFVPEEFVFDMRFSVNNNTVLRRRVSASDPPPVCFNPGRAPFVEVCAELSNIHIKNRNAHACLDVNADIGGFPVYSTSFKCFSLGSSGVKTGLKPKPIKKPAGAPAATNLFGNGDDDDDDVEGLLGGDGILGEDGLLGGGEGGILGGGEEGGIFGGGDDGGFDGPDFDGAFDGAGELLDA